MSQFFARRVISFLLGTVLAASGAVVGLVLSGPAAAATGSDSCTSLTGRFPFSGPYKLSGCKSDVSATDPAEHGTSETKGTGTLTFVNPPAQDTIKWNAPFEGGSNVVVSTVFTEFVGGPGQRPDETERLKCPTGTQEVILSATVGGGTSGDNDINAKIASEVCANTSKGMVSLEPGSKLTITESSSS
jgi:hypothetical protein